MLATKRTAPCAACSRAVDVGDMDPAQRWFCSRFCATVADRAKADTGPMPLAMPVDVDVCSCIAIDSTGRPRGFHTYACGVSARVTIARRLSSRPEAR